MSSSPLFLSNLGEAVEEFLIRAHLRLEGTGTAQEPMPDKPLSSFLPLLPGSASPKRVSYASGSSMSGCNNCMPLA